MTIISFCVGMVRTNCYLVFDEKTKEGALIDAGDEAERLLAAIRENEVKLKYILLTHAHFDHILAVHEVLQETGAQYVVPEKDTWLLKREAMGQFKPFARNYIEDTPDLLAEEGTQVTFGNMTATYMSTPGHTPGSCVIQMGDVLFTGDTMFRGECGRCDLEGGDFGQMLSSLKRLAELPGDYQVLPGHEGISTLSEERKSNPYVLQALGQ